MSVGRFVWADLHSTDIEVSKKFFLDLFDWSHEEAVMGDWTYTMIGHKDNFFGGVVPIDPGTGGSSHWTSYLTVADVDAATEQAKALGATVYHGPDDIPGTGRFTSIADPQGADVNLFKLTQDESVPAPIPTPIGGISWHELLSSDAEGSKQFYSQLVGWTYDVSKLSGGEDYWLANQGEERCAGIMTKPPMMPASAWIIYFAVADMDAALAKLKSLGGQSYMEPIKIGNIGTIIYVSDPTGAPFAMIQEAPM